jgi:mono/diheme cytochrome c family protein
MHAPVSTFEHRGRQYLIAYSAGNALIGSARGDSVWLFGLEGTLAPVEPGTPVSRLAPAVPATTAVPAPPAEAAAVLAAATPATAQLTHAAANRSNGREVFLGTCAVCHGEDGLGGHGGGPPLNAVQSFEAVVETARDGRNYMPEFGSLLSPEQLRDVAAYVAERFSGIAPQ